MPATDLASLVLGLVMLQGVEGPDPAELVGRLGASRYADREAAGEALIKMGRPALPALARARDSRDPEVRRRAEMLVARIEAAEVLDATRVRLDIRDRPLAEAVAAIAGSTGQTLKPGSVESNSRLDPSWPDVHVTVVTDEPVPFWQAVDRLCEVGGLQRLYPPAENLPLPFRPPFALTLIAGHARPPTSDHGAFRVELQSIRYDRQREYAERSFGFSPAARPGAGARDPETGALDRATYTAGILVSTEPRLRIIGVGAVENAEVIDDRGRSLLSVPTAGEQAAREQMLQANPHLDPALHPGLRYGSGWRRSTRAWSVVLPLSYPSPRAHRIEKLRGVIPVVAVARRPDPLVVELKDAAGKTFSAGANRITVHETKSGSGREPTVELTLESPPVGGDQTIAVHDERGRRLEVNQPIDLMELRLEVVDGRGESLFWQFTRSPSAHTQGRMAIVIHDRSGTREGLDGLRLRYWDLIGAATDVPFAFKNVPTP